MPRAAARSQGVRWGQPDARDGEADVPPALRPSCNARRMYERRTMPPIPLRRFLRRLANHVLVATGLVAASLAAGMAGYAAFERLGWLDAFLNAAMLMGGMGPVDPPRTDAGKLFAGLYALYCGLVFLISTGIAAAPVFHRILHRFHWVEETSRRG